jgi:colanic acid biosynthesis protein WcaH
MIPEEKYKYIIEVLPILCVDIMLKNDKGEYPLIKRGREPLIGHWWVIGGRVLKGEDLKGAAIRKVSEETGIAVNHVKLIGYYEDAYDNNPFGLSVPLHSVSVVFSGSFKGDQDIKLDYQSVAWKFSKKLTKRFKIKLLKSIV